MVEPPFEARVRLCAYVGTYWATFDGGFAARGLDPLDLPFHRFLNAGYHFLIREMTRQGSSLDDAEKLVSEQLTLPIPGRKVKNTEEVVSQEMSMFKSAQATMGR